MGVQNIIVNSLLRRFGRGHPIFGGSRKHDHYRDFGWPDTLTFNDFYRMYSRNGLASAAIDKTIAKTWQTEPAFWESDKPAETQLEAEIANHFRDARLWQALANTDRRGMVGAYAGAILMLADGQAFDQPVTRVSGGIKSLVGIIPAWEGQLKVAEWDENPASATYGKPRAFQFDESAVDRNENSRAARSVRIHPDRVIVWSEDGTVDGRSVLEPGFNDLIDAEKVKGAGGEGFWKTSRGAPIFEAPEGMDMNQFLKSLGVETSAEAVDALNEQLDNFQSGFDKGLMMGGLQTKVLQISLPQPEEFFNVPVQSFAASMQMPVRVLIGNQTGERASTEDAREWAQTCMSRRSTLVIPCLRDLLSRLVKWGVLPARDWQIGWDDLTEATAAEKMDRASKMSEINARAAVEDDLTFTPDEIREAAGYKPMTAGNDMGRREGLDPPQDDGDME